MLRPILIVLAATLLLAGCGGDDKAIRLDKTEYDTFTGFYGATVENIVEGKQECDKVKRAKDTPVLEALGRFCTGGVDIQNRVAAVTLAVQRFCPKQTTGKNCIGSIKELRKQYGRVGTLLSDYNAGIEDALADGDCRAELRDTDAARMAPFLDNMDAAIEALAGGDTQPFEQLGTLPEQDPNSDLKVCQPT